MNAKSSNLAKNLFIVVIYLVLSVLWCSNFFALADLRSPALSDGDSALNAWALNWVSRALVSDWSNLFNGNTFYPHLNSIALSEHLVGLALLNIPVHLVFDDAWIGYNLLIFESYFFSALGGYLFIQHISSVRLNTE